MDQNVKKNAIYSLFLVLALVGIWWHRGTQENDDLGHKMELYGETMGTTYVIKYLHEERTDFQKPIDSLLQAVNMSLSTYIPDSEISQFNRNAILKYKLPFFYPVLNRSYEIYQDTEGAFDPTVGPLVNAWGFGPDTTQVPPQATIDSLLQLVNFDSVYFDTISVCKLQKGIQLDFSAIAKGFGVDIVAAFLKDKGIENMMVEIGGEVYCQGRNTNGNMWKIGINNPKTEEEDRLKAVVTLDNKALATSGNYLNYYVKDGKKYSHTIDPQTGHPVEHTLLSASVFAPDCMTADAYATAFMVMGTQKARAILEKDTTLEAYLIYSDEEGNVKSYFTEGMKNFISE